MVFVALMGVIIVVWAVFVYNRFVKLSNCVSEGWSGIDVQLRRRYDLIPNLVEAVKGYKKYEKETLKALVDKRNEAMKSKDIGKRQDVENQLTGALSNMFALAEGYPDLKASENFIQLQKTLVDIENHLQKARRYYNATVRDFNIAVDSFPAMVVAKAVGFDKKAYFEIVESERANVKVKVK